MPLCSFSSLFIIFPREKFTTVLNFVYIFPYLFNYFQLYPYSFHKQHSISLKRSQSGFFVYFFKDTALGLVTSYLHIVKSKKKPSDTIILTYQEHSTCSIIASLLMIFLGLWEPLCVGFLLTSLSNPSPALSCMLPIF